MAKKKSDKLVADLLADLIESPQDIDYVELFDKKWGFRQITTKDHLGVLKKTQALNKDEAARVFGITLEYLRNALVSVEGIILTDEQKSQLLENISPAMLNALFFEFEKVSRRKADERIESEKAEETESDEDEADEKTTSNNVIDN